MKYEILFDKPAQKFILKQPPSQRTRLLAAISRLPDEGDRKALQGHPGYYRLRVGDYRVIYTVEKDVLIVRIVNIGSRGDIYKKIADPPRKPSCAGMVFYLKPNIIRCA